MAERVAKAMAGISDLEPPDRVYLMSNMVADFCFRWQNDDGTMTDPFVVAKKVTEEVMRVIDYNIKLRAAPAPDEKVQ